MLRNRYMVIFALVIVTLSGCATNLGIHDSSVPEDKLCTLDIDDELAIRQFNGDSVKWYGGFLSHGSSVRIPSGNHTFVIDWERGNRRVMYARNIRYSHTFEPGKTYYMKAVVSGDRVTIEVTP